MKLPVILFASIAISCSANAANILSKSGSPGHIDVENQPRKLTLFVRATHTSKTDATEPIFGGVPGVSALGDVPVDSMLGDSRLNGASQPLSVDSMLGDSRLNGASRPVGTMDERSDGEDCHPKCWWNCGTADCDEVCDPVCAPPQCETACGAINAAACRQVCQPPTCAIVCPTQHCSHGRCPACKTVCAPPKCTTQCAEQCESKCSDPQCTWRCNPGKCEKPRCTLTCGGAKACGLDGNLNARPPPFGRGMTVVSKALAFSNPRVLANYTSSGTHYRRRRVYYSSHRRRVYEDASHYRRRRVYEDASHYRRRRVYEGSRRRCSITSDEGSRRRCSIPSDEGSRRRCSIPSGLDHVNATTDQKK